MRERTWIARRDKLLAEEAQQPESWWWLSFAGEEGFRGAILTRARGMISAIQKTHEIGINPGGEVKCFPIPHEAEADHPWEQFANRLLSKEEIDQKMGGAQKMP